jgi:hypothetical protein
MNTETDISNLFGEIEISSEIKSPCPTWRPPAQDSGPPPIRRQRGWNGHPKEFEQFFTVAEPAPRRLKFDETETGA